MIWALLEPLTYEVEHKMCEAVCEWPVRVSNKTTNYPACSIFKPFGHGIQLYDNMLTYLPKCSGYYVCVILIRSRVQAPIEPNIHDMLNETGKGVCVWIKPYEVPNLQHILWHACLLNFGL